MAEFMDVGFAVFNNHVNDADRKARAIMREVAPKMLERVEEIEEEGNGIMHIFNVDQEPATLMYSSMVTALVNLRALDGEPEPGPGRRALNVGD